mmetsp:Transcript_20429/g.56851  ORF Transcript_20429/g.56851 Transcript_20429/m.56851 type:complete len:80 (+) Transcript_20429:141-380(+)
MGLSLWNLLKASLLLANAAMILNRKRFLAQYGLDDITNGDTSNPLKVQLTGMLHAMQYLKVPVIALNAFTIVFEIILGS